MSVGEVQSQLLQRSGSFITARASSTLEKSSTKIVFDPFLF